jgi:hypothetical protein
MADDRGCHLHHPATGIDSYWTSGRNDGVRGGVGRTPRCEAHHAVIVSIVSL